MGKCLRRNYNVPEDLREFYVSIRGMPTPQLAKLSADLGAGLSEVSSEIHTAKAKRRLLRRMLNAVTKTVKENEHGYSGTPTKQVDGQLFYNLASLLSLTAAPPKGWRRCSLYNDTGGHIGSFNVELQFPKNANCRLVDLLDDSGVSIRRYYRRVYVDDVFAAMQIVSMGGKPLKLTVRYPHTRRREYVSSRLHAYWVGEAADVVD